MNERATIRSATSSDFERVAHLWAEHVDAHARLDPRFERTQESEDVFAQYLREGNERAEVLLLVAEVGGQVVGFLHGEASRFPPCFVHTAHGLVNDIAVSPRWQRKGLGAKLLHRAMTWFRERGVPTVEANVLILNPAAMGFWAKAGFEPYLQTMRMPVGGEGNPGEGA